MEQLKLSLNKCDEDRLKEIKVYIDDLLSHSNAQVFHVIGSKTDSGKAFPFRYPLSVNCIWYQGQKFPVPDDSHVYEFYLHDSSDSKTDDLFVKLMVGELRPGKYRIDFRECPENIYRSISWMRPV